MSWEFAFLDFLQANVVNDFLTPIMAFFTYAGSMGLIWIILTIVLLIKKETRYVGIAMALSLLLDLIIVNLCIKPLVHRIRPYDVNTAVNVLVRKPSDYSFPSGHTASSFACISTLFFFNKKKLFYIFLVVGTLIAFSRMYFYIHYPTDIICGAVIGVFCGYLASVIVKKYMEKKNIPLPEENNNA